MAKNRDSSDSRDPRRLVYAVSQAIGYELNPIRYEDMLIIQKGVYLLNQWGHGPLYDFNTYIEGPYSMELADDCRRNVKKGKKKGPKVPSDVLPTLSRYIIKDDTHVSKSFHLENMAKNDDDDGLLRAFINVRDALDVLIEELRCRNVENTTGKTGMCGSGDKKSKKS